MKLICGGRESGKARRLLEFAHNRDDIVVISPRPRSLRVKAQSYGYNVNICGIEDLRSCNYDGDVKFAIHNLNGFLRDYFQREVAAISVEVEDEDEVDARKYFCENEER